MVGIPDRFGFTHEPHHGLVYHRCIECDEYPWGCIVPERDRAKHHARHERTRATQVERARRQSLAKARQVKQQAERENRTVYKSREE